MIELFEYLVYVFFIFNGELAPEVEPIPPNHEEIMLYENKETGFYAKTVVSKDSCIYKLFK